MLRRRGYLIRTAGPRTLRLAEVETGDQDGVRVPLIGAAQPGILGHPRHDAVILGKVTCVIHRMT
jgi:hypothetical protein